MTARSARLLTLQGRKYRFMRRMISAGAARKPILSPGTRKIFDMECSTMTLDRPDRITL